MQIVWAVPCDSYELRDDGTAHIFGAGFDAFQVESLPATLDIKVVVGLLLEEGETSEVEVHVIGPQMTGIRSLVFPVIAEPGPLHRAGNMVSQIEALELPYEAETEAGYVVEVFVEGDAEPTSPTRRFSFFFSVVEGLPEQN